MWPGLTAFSNASFKVGFGPSPEQLEAKQKAKSDAKRAKKEAKKAKRARLKANDPKLCAFSRELRDRWQEHVEAQPGLIEGAAQPRYDVGRLIAPASGTPGNSFTPTEAPEVVVDVLPGAGEGEYPGGGGEAAGCGVGEGTTQQRHGGRSGSIVVSTLWRNGTHRIPVRYHEPHRYGVPWARSSSLFRRLVC